jgi:hypothetical protein
LGIAPDDTVSPAAPRKAFVGDGLEANWTVWRKRFSHYTPIEDFIHALRYVFGAALAARRLREGWPIYCQWAQWIWSGRVTRPRHYQTAS